MQAHANIYANINTISSVKHISEPTLLIPRSPQAFFVHVSHTDVLIVQQEHRATEYCQHLSTSPCRDAQNTSSNPSYINSTAEYRPATPSYIDSSQIYNLYYYQEYQKMKAAQAEAEAERLKQKQKKVKKQKLRVKGRKRDRCRSYQVFGRSSIFHDPRCGCNKFRLLLAQILDSSGKGRRVDTHHQKNEKKKERKEKKKERERKTKWRSHSPYTRGRGGVARPTAGRAIQPTTYTLQPPAAA
ncbi:predicted protein [Histoplasma capsulatum G186AR]|uniref:Uncharacterized protein n=1 Tax=Ajellomyces capsulatus (strain G186AR / H82 / ATCC MYA-2454 / RMSCC 2432) TaxID=447093 RepID=C0NPT4_AJECG|nr:uncharacterized protein HCBG_05164 [Histoplasma capsulatum G186AR]EEH06944.1 predicted protein [Histoplasma capsulatum G186AR]